MKDSVSENIKTESTEETVVKTEQSDNGDPNTSLNKDVNVKNENVTECVKQEPDITLEMKTEDGEVKVENIKEEEKSTSENTTQNGNGDAKTDPPLVKTEITEKLDNSVKPESENNKNTEKPPNITKGETETSVNNDSQIKEAKSRRKRKRPLIRNRAKKRKLVQQQKEAVTVDAGLEPVNSPETVGIEDDIEYCLTVTNLPNNWSFMDIKNYIDTECGPVDEIEMLKDEKTDMGAIRLSYQTEQECKEAMNKLTNKEINGTKLILEMSVVSLEFDDTAPENETPPESLLPPAPSVVEPEEQKPTKPWRPDLDVWEIDPEGLYGLKNSFLKSLDISPPLDKWIHVSNFRCDRSELRDILDMAGTVLMCSVFNTTPKYANVMYSHPLEAVQAVSMLNGQTFYGQKLKLVMDRSPVDTILLPKGLTNIGQGLGAYGKPLRNITRHYYRFVTNKSSSINKAAFKMPNEQSESNEESTFTVKSVEDFNYVMPTSSNTNTGATVTTTKTNVTPAKATVTPTAKPIQKLITPNPIRSPKQNFQPRNNFGPRPFGPNQASGWSGPGPVRPMGPMQGNMGPMGPVGPMQGPMGRMQGPMGPMQGPMGPMQGPMGPNQGHMGPNQSYMGPMQGPMGSMQEQMSWSTGNEPVQLHLSNLPPSTTFHLLCGKMAECGQVVSIQLTTPGCAVVTFANRMQADRCFQTYNGKYIEGHVMQIRYT